jgi:hypothetical protein
VGCDDAFDRFALGVDRETFGSELLQSPQDGWTGAEGILVEVEAERIAAGEGRMVLGHGQYGLARLY